MGRWRAATAAAVLTGASVAGGGAAAKPATRTVVESYSPAKFSPLRINVLGPWVSLSEVSLYAREGETSITVELDDESGTRVRGSIQQAGMPARDFCGATPKPFEIVPAKELYLIVYSGPCDGSVAIATAGTATVTFHRTRGGSR